MTFLKFISQLKGLDYQVEFRELVAADYGAPTMRKRFFLIARCDKNPIVWPNATHGARDETTVKMGIRKPYRSAAEIIDWSIPCPSIFECKKPLAENTMKRIARGLQKFVINNSEPFVVNHGFLIAPTLIQYHTETIENSVRAGTLNKPIGTEPYKYNCSRRRTHRRGGCLFDKIQWMWDRTGCQTAIGHNNKQR